jgi:diguanylate cyclase (GGDEF)-like protein
MFCSAITAVATIPIFLSTHTLGIDLSLYLYVILGYIILYATINYEVFDLAPLAHRATFEYSTDPMLLLDDRFEIISWNQAIQSFQTRPLIYRMSLKRYIRDDELYSAILMKQTSTFIIKEKRYIIETIDLRTKRGRINGYLVKFNDMTAYLEKIERLDFDASHDALTKLLNRRAFFERVDRYFQFAIGSQEPFAVLMIDIDDFKQVNDTYGHLVGDLLLEDLSNVLYRNLPDNVVFSRYGGEEFVGLIPQVQLEEALRLANIARVAVENRWFVYGEITIQIQVSIGVSHGVVDGYQDIMNHIHQADMGMYQAKNSGKNCVMTASPNQN